MSGLPIFADPSTAVVYHTIPGAPAGGATESGQGGQGQQQLPPTIAMTVVKNNPRQDMLSNIPLPPGMEIVLGDKKYKIQYQSYEMTREKANEYIAKCTGTPYSRMSAPPDPGSFYGVAGASRGDGTGGPGEASLRTTGHSMEAKPAAISTPTVGDRGVYTTTTPAASGLPSEPTRGAALSQQQQQHIPQHLPMVPEYQTTTPAYAPPPKDANEDQQSQGYYWEDGVWKVWQGDGGQSSSTASKLPPAQPNQPPQPPFPSQLQSERPKYDYQYQQQQSQQPSQLPRPQTLFATSTTQVQSPQVSTYTQTQQQPTLPPIIRGPPPQPLNLLQRQPSSSSSNAGADPHLNLPRYI